VTVEPAELAALIGLVADGTLNRTSAREVLDDHASSGDSVASIVDRRGLRQISDSDALGTVVDEVLVANPDAVADVRAGKEQAIKFLVGQVMKATRGQANAAVAQAAIRQRLGDRPGGAA
jgi:aspartyl-tRNA(Asn)/glutamyl-tRNA(Gln) amidotransferase subunit B